MDFNRDELRRQLRTTQEAHGPATRRFRAALDRLLHATGAEATAAKRDLLLNGLDRRRFLRVGGVAVVSTAILGACGGGDDAATDATTTTSGPPNPTADDITILRTATSIENLAVQVYTRAIEGGLLTTPTVLAAAKLFKEQHEDHAELLRGATANADGEPFDGPNPVVLQQLTPTIQGLRDERGVVRLAYDLEQSLAATYQSNVGKFTATRFNETVMSIAGVEARHAAILGAVIAEPIAPSAFAAPEGAIAAGTGVG